jgi:hypothetical protein
MIGTIERKDNKVITPVSAYQPSKEVRDLTIDIQQDNQVGYNLQNQNFEEFNDESLLSRMDIDQKKWNAYRYPTSPDVDEQWRYNGIRPTTRNRILGIVAQMTAQIVIPAPFAQDDQDEIDRMAAQVMRDLMEYNIRNSSYVEDYINWITDALVNPIAYMGVGFFEHMQTIREENEGRITKKQVIDDVFSGFQTSNIPTDEVLWGNYYQRNLQKQRFMIRRRYIDFDEAQAKWGEHENFNYVHPGLNTVFDGETSLFYDTKDDNLETLVEELTYYNRSEDIEIPFVNGIYVGASDVEANPIKHRDNENKPKYGVAGLGYEPISSRFMFYKSAAWKLGDDDELVTRMEQLTVDATFLSVMPPTITTGAEQMTEAIVIPGKNTVFSNADVKVQPIQLGSAIQAGWNAIMSKENSMSQSTQDPMMTGVQTQPKTASEAMLLAQNAKIALGRFGNMLANSLKTLGGLMIDVILQHQTVGEIEETVDGETVQKFKSFIVADVVDEEGQKLTKKITFKPEMMGEELVEEDMMARSMEMMEKEGGVDSDMRIYEVNPDKWRKLKYMMHIDIDELLPMNLRQNQINQLAQMEQTKQGAETNQKVGVA